MLGGSQVESDSIGSDPSRDGQVGPGEDPLLWLEDLDGEAALAWVRARNEEAVASLAGAAPSAQSATNTMSPGGRARFGQLRDEIRQVLDAADRIPYPVWRGEYLYNLWRDQTHQRGLWRRTTLAEFRTPAPVWQELLDLDALAADESENWVWQGATALRPDNQRYLVSLSRGGSDACVVRELDLATGSFVDGGFSLPEAKSSVGWIDIDWIYVATDFGPGTLTSSGYPRVVKKWRRGTPLAEATVVYECGMQDVGAFASHDQTPGFSRGFVGRFLDHYRRQTYLCTSDREQVRIDVPEDATIDVHREWLLIELRTQWSVAGRTYPAGAVLVTRLDAFMAGRRDDLTMVFEPSPGAAYSYHRWTLHHLVLVVLSDVRSSVMVLTLGDGWRRIPVDGVPAFSHTEVWDTNPDHSDECLLISTGFLEPTTLRYATVGAAAEPVKQAPAFFDATALVVRQYFATSADGTRVPYFVVGDPDAADAPTLMTGYGGFQISLTPGYNGVIGRGWLARGGTYVVANIRGGGEYGPDWHRAAMRENRPRAFEDFAAVGADLAARGITSPARLGIEGGSNGGLLMGVMLTRYPHLFGAVVAQVPLLDMRRYHHLLAGASWTAEYGDPDEEADWAYLQSYSPYHNIHSGQTYPPVLFITSTRDDRVHPGHARKMAERLRSYGYDVTYYENVDGGHATATDNAQLAFQRALMLEFLWRALGD